MIKTLARSLRERKKGSVFTILLSILEAAFEILIPLCMADVIDKGIDLGDMSAVWKYGIALLIFAAFQLITGVLAAHIAAKTSVGFAANLRQDMYDNVQTFAFSNIDKFSTASIVTRLTTDVTNIQNAYQMIIRMLIRGPIMLIFAMAVSFSIHTRIALVFLAVIPFMAAALVLIVLKVNPIFKRVFKTYDRLNNVVQENVRGIRVVKSFNRESSEVEKFKDISKSIYEDFSTGERLIAYNSPIMQFFMYMCTILISWIGAKSIIASGNVAELGLTTGDLTALFSYAMQVLMSLMMLSMFLQTLIDDHITPLLGSESPVFSGLAKALLVIGIVYLIGVLSTLFYNRIMVTIAQGTLKKIRDEMFEKMQRLPIRSFDSRTHGDIMSLYTNDTDTLRQMIAQSLAHLISSVFTIVSVLVCMLYISIGLTLIALAVLFLILVIVKFVTGKIGIFFIMQQKTLADVNGYVEEMVNGQKVIKVFCHEEKAKEELRRKNAMWAHAAASANSYANSMMPMMNALGYLQYVIIALFGAYMAIAGVTNLGLAGTGTLTLGMIASFLTLSRSFTNPVSQISNQFNSIVVALAGASRIFAFMDEEPEADDGYVTLVNATEENGVIAECAERTGIWAWKHPHHDGTITYTKLEGRVVLDSVDFGYVPEKQVLYDVSLYAEPGQKIAFVGATGAGKTTITNLINRFYDIADGKIRYDGININKIKKADLRRSLGVVLQDVNLFTGTVMENLRYGNPDATDEDCIAAAKLANADGFIRMLPDGYNTVLKGDGSGLSQGQRQLISIARAAVSDPPVMILDEATSSIDTRTEALVQDGMDKLMKGRTVFVIAHRLSTVQNSDVIMVLEHGHIIERGPHDDLIAKKGKYYQLYTGAFELE